MIHQAGQDMASPSSQKSLLDIIVVLMTQTTVLYNASDPSVNPCSSTLTIVTCAAARVDAQAEASAAGAPAHTAPATSARITIVTCSGCCCCCLFLCC